MSTAVERHSVTRCRALNQLVSLLQDYLQSRFSANTYGDSVDFISPQRLKHDLDITFRVPGVVERALY